MMKQGHLRALGKRIQELRKDRNLTQERLAERCSLTFNYIGKIERGEAQPTLEALLSIANALKSNLSALFTYLDRPLTSDEAKARIRELLDQL
jgi:transcriptional regulator with XRE-family HTH domain